MTFFFGMKLGVEYIEYEIRQIIRMTMKLNASGCDVVKHDIDDGCLGSDANAKSSKNLNV